MSTAWVQRLCLPRPLRNGPSTRPFPGSNRPEDRRSDRWNSTDLRIAARHQAVGRIRARIDSTPEPALWAPSASGRAVVAPLGFFRGEAGRGSGPASPAHRFRRCGLGPDVSTTPRSGAEIRGATHRSHAPRFAAARCRRPVDPCRRGGGIPGKTRTTGSGENRTGAEIPGCMRPLARSWFAAAKRRRPRRPHRLGVGSRGRPEPP